MRIIHRIGKSWVAVPDSNDNGFSHIDDILQADAVLSDLDGTHAPSPAKEMTKYAVGTKHWDLDYLTWCSVATTALVAGRKDLEQPLGRIYIKTFLSSDDTDHKLSKFFTPERVSASLFPGVKDLAKHFVWKDWSYVTRNIHPIAVSYADELGVHHIFAEEYLKGERAYKHAKDNPHLRNFVVETDTVEEGDMIHALRECGRKTTGILVMDSPDKIPKPFTYGVSEDRTALVDLLSRYDNSQRPNRINKQDLNPTQVGNPQYSFP